MHSIGEESTTRCSNSKSSSEFARRKGGFELRAEHSIVSLRAVSATHNTRSNDSVQGEISRGGGGGLNFIVK